MRTFFLHSRGEWLASLVAAAVVSVAILGAAALLFVDDGRTPWFTPGSPLARQAERCEQLHASSERHACLRAVAKKAADVPLAAGHTLLEH